MENKLKHPSTIVWEDPTYTNKLNSEFVKMTEKQDEEWRRILKEYNDYMEGVDYSQSSICKFLVFILVFYITFLMLSYLMRLK